MTRLRRDMQASDKYSLFPYAIQFQISSRNIKERVRHVDWRHGRMARIQSLYHQFYSMSVESRHANCCLRPNDSRHSKCHPVGFRSSRKATSRPVSTTDRPHRHRSAFDSGRSPSRTRGPCGHRPVATVRRPTFGSECVAGVRRACVEIVDRWLSTGTRCRRNETGKPAKYQKVINRWYVYNLPS